MNSTITINDRLEYAAETGAYNTTLFVWGNTAKRLRSSGIVLTKTNVPATAKGCLHYSISWEKASVDIPEGPFVLEEMIRKLNADQIPVSQGNLLWLMAESYNRHKAFEAEEAARKEAEKAAIETDAQ